MDEKRDVTLTDCFKEVGVYTFEEAIKWVHQLSYSRNSDHGDYRRIFKESRGTCSTKHAALAAFAKELSLPIKLKLLIYPQHIPGFGDFPEAHCLLSTPEVDLDVTHRQNSTTPTLTILDETFIEPDDIRDFKPAWHRAYLEKHFNEPIEELLRIRERWISGL